MVLQIMRRLALARGVFLVKSLWGIGLLRLACIFLKDIGMRIYITACVSAVTRLSALILCNRSEHYGSIVMKYRSLSVSSYYYM